MHTTIKLIVALLCLSTICQAQIYNCDGTWTNKECSGKTSQIKETTKTPASTPSKDLAKKKTWINELDLLRLKAKREHQIQVSISAIEDICLTPSTTLADCSKTISDKEKQINELIIAKQNSEQKSKQKQSEEKPSTNTTVTIYNNEENNYKIIRPKREQDSDLKSKIEPKSKLIKE